MKHTLAALYHLATSAALAASLIGALFVFVRLLDEACTAARVCVAGPTITHLACVGLGAALLYVLQLVRGWSNERRVLPPATAQQLASARRARRLEMREPPARWIPPSRDHFSDRKETR